MRNNPDGTQKIITQSHQSTFETTADKAKLFTEGTLPNGLAFTENGDIYISNFGTDCLEIMTREGETKVLINSIDGEPIGKVNFILRDSKNRIWWTVIAAASSGRCPGWNFYPRWWPCGKRC